MSRLLQALPLTRDAQPQAQVFLVVTIHHAKNLYRFVAILQQLYPDPLGHNLGMVPLPQYGKPNNLLSLDDQFSHLFFGLGLLPRKFSTDRAQTLDQAILGSHN